MAKVIKALSGANRETHDQPVNLWSLRRGGHGMLLECVIAGFESERQIVARELKCSLGMTNICKRLVTQGASG